MIDAVTMDDAASPSEVDAVTRVLRQRGFPVTVLANHSRRSDETMPWLIQIVLGAPFAAFFASLATEAGKDAYHSFASFVRDLRKSRRAGSLGRVSIVDPNDFHLDLRVPLSAQAVAALAEVDWPQSRSGYVVWDEERGLWVEPFGRDSQSEIGA